MWLVTVNAVLHCRPTLSRRFANIPARDVGTGIYRAERGGAVTTRAFCAPDWRGDSRDRLTKVFYEPLFGLISVTLLAALA